MEPKHIDLTFLRSFTKENQESMAKYIGMFLKLSAPALETMKANADQSNWAELRSTAHSLKPQIGYMGIGELKEVILKIETYAKEQRNLEEMPALLSQYETTYHLACKELEQALSELEIA